MTQAPRLNGARPLTDAERQLVARNPHYAPDCIAPPAPPRSTDNGTDHPNTDDPQNGR